MTAPVFDRLSTLADPTRSRLLMLLDRHELTVGELCAVMQLPQSSVSRHLKALADDGWVSSRAEATSRYYRRSGRLPDAALQLWQLVRQDLSEGLGFEEDIRRLDAVLAARSASSRTFFRTAAARWDVLRGEMFGERLDLHLAVGLLDPEWTFGDLGCGTGHLSALLAPCVRGVIAVDGSEEMLRGARERLGDTPNVELRLGELEHLPIADAALDAAAVSLVLHYVPEPLAVLTDAHRVLRPGGRLVVMDMQMHGRAEYRELMGHVWQGFSEAQVTEWLSAAGFTRISVRSLPLDAKAKGPALFIATATA